jgi:flagellar assembly protein FliH
MSTVGATGHEVLRGLPLDATPLRLGRAPAGVASASAEHAGREQALRDAQALALKEAREEARRAGHAEGLREGRAHAAEEIRQAVQRAVAEAVQPLQAQHERLQEIARNAQGTAAVALAAAEDEMVALCFEALCRLVGERSAEPEAVRAQVAQLLALHGGADVLLHVHPQDAELLERGAEGQARWVADPQVALGGCILKSSGGALDARLETMLAACKAALLEARARRRQAVADGEAP